MYSRLNNFLEQQKILIKNQFGFRKYHSSYMASMIMMDEIIKALNNDDCVVGIFLDFSKAFDTVNHDILLDKLCHYGVRDNALDWFRSYLSGRRQFVTYNGVSSSTKTITCGVPQGSILGPLLFLLYINDLYNVCSTSVPLLYADDTNLFYKGKDIDTLVRGINFELGNISTWLKVNKLSLNVKKKHYMLFSNHKSKHMDAKITIDGHKIDQVVKTKFLGVVIDNKLNWKEHVSLISGKISRSIGMIIKAKHSLNKDALMTLYNSFIYPYLSYCNQVWGCTYNTTLKKLFTLQKLSLRIMFNMKKRESLEKVLHKENILRFTVINLYLICKFMFRYYNGKIPDIFQNIFMINSDIHDHYTRQSGSYHVPKVKNNLGKWSIRYRCVVVWNTILSLKINPETSEAVFAKTVKKCIINQSLSLWLFYICWYKLRFITFHRTNVYGNLSISFWIILEAPRYVIDVWLTIINDRMLLSTHFVLFYAHHRMYYDERVINRFGAHKLCPSFSLLLFHFV